MVKQIWRNLLLQMLTGNLSSVHTSLCQIKKKPLNYEVRRQTQEYFSSSKHAINLIFANSGQDRGKNQSSGLVNPWKVKFLVSAGVCRDRKQEFFVWGLKVREESEQNTPILIFISG